MSYTVHITVSSNLYLHCKALSNINLIREWYSTPGLWEREGLYPGTTEIVNCRDQVSSCHLWLPLLSFRQQLQYQHSGSVLVSGIFLPRETPDSLYWDSFGRTASERTFELFCTLLTPTFHNRVTSQACIPSLFWDVESSQQLLFPGNISWSEPSLNKGRSSFPRIIFFHFFLLFL